jgi:uncharacterized coiled-coil DUF342 family protein
MKNICKAFSLILLGTISCSSLIADKRDPNLAAVYEDGFSAIKDILDKRDAFRERAAELEAAKSALERLLSDKEGSDVGELIEKLALLKKELETIFVSDSDKPGMAEIVEKITILKKELEELFPPEDDGQGSDIVKMIEKLSELKNELKELFPESGDSDLSEGSVADAVERLTALKEELLELFPVIGDDPEGQDLQTRIRKRIEKYIKELAAKEKAMKKLRKDARKMKKDFKEVKEYLVELVNYAKENKD